MFTPASLALEEEYYKGGVIANIWREYLEEVFSRKEPEIGQDDWRYIYGDERLKFLLKLIEAGEAQLYFTGVAVQLLNFLPAICSLLLIRTPKWHKFHLEGPSDMRFNLNAEYASHEELPEILETGKKAITRIPYSEDDNELMRYLQVANVVPEGAAAIWLGVDAMRRILKT